MTGHELSGYRPAETPAARTGRAGRILQDLVRPEWRIEPPIPTDPRNMIGVCAVPRCPREVVRDGLCNGHVLRWDCQGQPTWDRFVTTTGRAITEALAVPPCRVPWCRRARYRLPEHMCAPHSDAWRAAGRPPARSWAAALAIDDPGAGAPTCRLSQCQLLVESDSTYCRVHDLRWQRAGRPDPEVFLAVTTNIGDPRWDFSRLPTQVKLELQYGMQRHHDLGYPDSSHAVGPVARMLLRLGTATVLDYPAEDWSRIFVANNRRGFGQENARAFLLFVVRELIDLLDGAGWDNEYPRDTWQLHRLGLISTTATRSLHFDDIGQAWLRDCAKRWLHWRITVEEKSINTVTADLLALRRLSRFLTATGQGQHSIRQLTRPVLEQHVVWLHQHTGLAACSIRDSISAIAVFLRTLRDHEDWAPNLPRTAVIYGSDYPRMDPMRARGLSPHVMAQVRAWLEQHWPHPDGRFLTRLMISTGLRLGDACALPFDPLVFDSDDNPYLHYWNAKMRREAYVPLSQTTLQLIRDQQRHTADRFPAAVAAHQAAPAPRRLPAAGLKLTPGVVRNPDGSHGFHRGTYNQQLRNFLVDAAITDDASRPAAITSHQWRHTFATELINRGVRLEVVKQLLDHSSLEMSSHYARLLDKTIRAEWEAGRGPDQPDGDHLLPRDVEWANRARTALPNGHCGLPRQQTCDHSNRCLPCPVFITTSRDLAVHEEQRQRTVELIAKFDADGHTWLADQNRGVLAQLDQRIAEIQRNRNARQMTGVGDVA